jgi:hypothetical protein
MTVFFNGFCSAAFFVADLAAAGTVFFAVTDFTADLAGILLVTLFIADFAVARLLLSLFAALALAVFPVLRIIFATVAFIAGSLKHY